MRYLIATLALAGLFAIADDSEACRREGRRGLFRGRCGILHRHTAAACATCEPATKEMPKADPKKETPKKKAATDTFRPLTAKEFPIAETLLAGPPPPPLDAMIGHTYQWHVNDQGELLYKRVTVEMVIRAEFVSPR